MASEPSEHIYQGSCPDDLDRDARDPNCPACGGIPAGRLAAVIAERDAAVVEEARTRDELRRVLNDGHAVEADRDALKADLAESKASQGVLAHAALDRSAERDEAARERDAAREDARNMRMALRHAESESEGVDLDARQSASDVATLLEAIATFRRQGWNDQGDVLKTLYDTASKIRERSADVSS